MWSQGLVGGYHEQGGRARKREGTPGRGETVLSRRSLVEGRECGANVSSGRSGCPGGAGDLVEGWRVIRRYEVLEIPRGEVWCPDHGAYWTKRGAKRRAAEVAKCGVEAATIAIVPLRLVWERGFRWTGDYESLEPFVKPMRA